MAVLNHHIVAAHDKRATALFFAGILGLEPPAMLGEFAIVEASNDSTLDFVDTDDEIHHLHDAFAPRVR
jgi:hypothetical protein